MKQLRTQSGFTLIELLVSLAIFTIVITITVGTLLVLIDANAKAQNMQTAMTNLNFALDSMTREIRTGSDYYCRSVGAGSIDNGTGEGNGLDPLRDSGVVRNCNTPGNYLEIIEGGNSLTGDGAIGVDARIGYSFDANYYGQDHGAILRRVGDGSWQPMTARELRITNMDLLVQGTDPLSAGDATPPSVAIWLTGSAGEFSDTDTTYTVSTTVTQRLLDI